MNNNVTIAQIKEALSKSTQEGGLYVDEAQFLNNAPTYISYLLDELEKSQRGRETALSSHRYMEEELIKAQKEAEFWKSAAETQKDNNVAILKEHAAMKMALEWISSYRETLPTSAETYQFAEAFLMAEDKAGYVLSTLQCPTE